MYRNRPWVRSLEIPFTLLIRRISCLKGSIVLDRGSVPFRGRTTGLGRSSNKSCKLLQKEVVVLINFGSLSVPSGRNVYEGKYWMKSQRGPRVFLMDPLTNFDY